MITSNSDPRNKTLKKIMNAKTHTKLITLCNIHGGQKTYRIYGGEIASLFEDNLFVPNCVIRWNKYNFKGAKFGLI